MPRVGARSLPPRTFFGHPWGLMVLFFTEMWERFSYYGNRALLILFMTAPVAVGGLGFGTAKAAPIYAMYTSLVYLAAVPGGWLADKFLGARHSVLLGGFIIMCGHILLVFHGLPMFYAGLGCIVLGTGLLKPNISVIVGQLYKADEEQRRAAGFSLFYMGINIGALIAPLTCGFLAQHPVFQEILANWGIDPAGAWHWGFGAAAVGMFFGLGQYVLTSRHLGEAGKRSREPRDARELRRNRLILRFGVGVILSLAIGLWAFDKTAEYLREAEWSAIPYCRFSASPLQDPSRIAEYAKGSAVSPTEMRTKLGRPDLCDSLDAHLRQGQTSGVFSDVNIVIRGIGGSWAIDSLRWKQAPFLQIVVTGKKVGTNKIIKLNKGDPLLLADFFSIVGPEAAKTVVQGIQRHQLTGTLASTTVDAGEGVDSLLVDRLEWSLHVNGDFALLGFHSPADTDTVHFKAVHSFTDLRGHIGEEASGRVCARLFAGQTEGRLSGLHLKHGGVTEHLVSSGYKVFMLLLIMGLFGSVILRGKWTPNERARLITIFVLFCGASVFWGVFEQAGSTLTLFADRDTNNSLFGFAFPSSWWQSLNPALIVLLAPVFAWFWLKLGRHNPSSPAKFAVGLLFAGLGFLVLVAGASSSGGWVPVSPMWLFSVYLLHTIGELWLSPVGLSAVAGLSPQPVVGLLMGTWFLGSSVGNLIGGSVSGYYESFQLPTLFGVIALSAGIVALIMFLLVGPIKRMMAHSEAA